MTDSFEAENENLEKELQISKMEFSKILNSTSKVKTERLKSKNELFDSIIEWTNAEIRIAAIPEAGVQIY